MPAYGSGDYERFLSTLSLRRATRYLCCNGGDQSYFYPRSPCGERHQPRNIVDTAIRISIHALLAESDPHSKSSWPHFCISIHALLAESDDNLQVPETVSKISIHALLAESDCNAAGHGPDGCLFLSTLSLRRATKPSPRSIEEFQISIHALLAESDLIQDYNTRVWADFYPRSPCGERRRGRNPGPRTNTISIHALLAESDELLECGAAHCKIFLSTLSLRRATIFSVRPYDAPIFLSTLSLRRATVWPYQRYFAVDISIHALLAESDCPQVGKRLI